MKARTPWQVTRAVWHAMFMREMSVRIMADRFAWFWMLFEPIAMISILVGIRSVIGSSIRFNGVEHVPWLVVGLLGFYVYRENYTRALGAIEGNRALFSYRQVQPIDPVIVRFFVEGALKTFVFLLFIGAGLLLDIDLVPDAAMLAMFYWMSMWLLGAGTGLVISVTSTLVQEVGWLARILSFPLLFISGVIFPIDQAPHFYRQLLMINPIAHGLELLRGAFFDVYRVMPETDPVYFWYWILGTALLGLMLHIRFHQRLLAT